MRAGGLIPDMGGKLFSPSKRSNQLTWYGGFFTRGKAARVYGRPLAYIHRRRIGGAISLRTYVLSWRAQRTSLHFILGDRDFFYVRCVLLLARSE